MTAAVMLVVKTGIGIEIFHRRIIRHGSGLKVGREANPFRGQSCLLKDDSMISGAPTRRARSPILGSGLDVTERIPPAGGTKLEKNCAHPCDDVSWMGNDGGGRLYDL
jgi:hypothetical protein